MLYKITAVDGSPCHGGSGKWSRPRGKRPGAWRTEKGPLRLCAPGTLHLCRLQDLSKWLVHDAVVWEAEVSGEIREADDKVGVLEARLVRKVGVLTRRLLVEWACDCADRALSPRTSASQTTASGTSHFERSCSATLDADSDPPK